MMTNQILLNCLTQNYAIYHGEPVCGEGERMYPAYHHEEYSGQTENLELMSNGTFVVSWDDRWAGDQW